MLERLAEVDRDFIKSKVQQGYYTSEIELVRDAVRKMREEDERQKRLDPLRALVMVGHEQAVKGEVVAYTDDFAVKAMEQALKNHQDGTPIKDEVKP